MGQDRQNRIRARAYELWDQAGRPEGRAQDHWDQAEREMARDPDEQPRTARKAAAPAAAGRRPSATAPSGARAPSRSRKTTTEAGLRSRGKKDPTGGQPAPGQDNDPKRGGYLHADTAMGTSHSEMLADLEQTVTGSGPPRQRGRDHDNEK